MCILFFGMCLAGCQGPYDEYQIMLDEELDSGERYDSLFLTLKFGMSKKDFFATCWELNKEGLLNQGPRNLSVEYDLENELRYPAKFYFYPQFHEEKIYRMPIEISYETRTPTDMSRSVDSLMVDVKTLMEDWYGQGFIYLENEDDTKRLYVKVDGNRRIRIFKKDLSTVAVDMTDMTVAMSKEDSDTNE